jgi:hypothetical protein
VAITLSASGGSNDMVHITDDVAGMYALELTAAQLNWTGEGTLTFTDPDVMAPRFIDIVVEPNNIYDSTMHGTDYVQMDVAQWLGTAAATPTTAGVPEVDLTHWLGTAAATPTVAGVPEVDQTHSGGVANATATIANAFGGSTFQAASDVKTAVEAAGSHLTLIKTKTDYLPSATAGAAGGVFIAGSNAATSVTTAFTANITGNLSGSVGSVTGALTVEDIVAGVGGLAVPGSFAAGTLGNIIGNTADQTDIETFSQTGAAAALTAYDPPTNAEMEARTIVAANYATASALDAVDNFVDTEVAAISTLLGTPAGASVSADIAAVKSDAAAAKTASEKIDTSTELRTLVTGSDTPVATAASQTSIANTLGTPAGASISADIAGISVTVGEDLFDTLINTTDHNIVGSVAWYLRQIKAAIGLID